MHVETSEARSFEDRLWQDQAIGHHDSRIGVMRPEGLLRAVFEGFWGVDRKRQTLRLALDRRALQREAAARRSWRSRIDGDDIVPARSQLDQRRYCKIGSTHEDQAHSEKPLAHDLIACEQCGTSGVSRYDAKAPDPRPAA